MTNCGNCLGIWSMITYDNYTPNSPYSYSGYELESPIFTDRAITTACSGRALYSDNSFYAGAIQAKNIQFTPNNPNCLKTSQKYDCINGQCIVSTQYNTPGQYTSLSDCQAVCTNGGACASGKQCVDPTTFCPPGQVCIGQDEYSNIQVLISKINSEVC